ncbi:RHS repeat-associated core domain-containing protein [Mucilaginibacter sp. HMF5004]|uniref:DUF6443 domain-containing protein n=1 Tax=Mucilaginibacter rivuli TaxID=2857527 RepID=UPI001C5E4BAA|nr:DUF6443 domain-containing protein [Mucilaginibacter rivuli]MBW4891121.1 RHS repeat-associated core domain-containing protein [Mucilaginibacter rivuli]
MLLYNKLFFKLKLKFITTGLLTVSTVATVTAPVVTNTWHVTNTVVAKETATKITQAHKIQEKSKTKVFFSPPWTVPCTYLAATASFDENYVETYTATAPVTADWQLHNTCASTLSVQYLDGIGRPMQNVQVLGNQDATKDIVQPIAYDELGREGKKYLPYADNVESIGSYRADALQTGVQQAAFYNTPPTGVTQIATPVAETNFEPSPLNRVLEQGAPGNDWQLSAGHTVKVSYGVNVANDVQQYEATPVTTNGLEYKRTLSALGSYPAGQLYLTVTKDENWVTAMAKIGTTEEYKDKYGRVILKRKYDSAGQALSTYYVYDYLGNLTFVLTPKADPDLGSISQAALDGLCYQYFYDGRKRLIEKKIPDKGWEYMVYNNQDQMVAVSDSNFGNSWKFTKYDNLGRIIITGWYYSGISNRATTQYMIDSGPQYETRVPGSDYTNVAWPTSSSYMKFTKTYYDNYDIPGLPSTYDFHTQHSQLTQGMATATISSVLYYQDMLWSVNYYDDLGRITDVYAQHYLQGYGYLNTGNYDHTTNTYNFNNQISTSKREHFTTTGGLTAKVTIQNTYYYDHMGRKKQSWEQINTPTVPNATNVLLSQVDYNDIGQPFKKHLHSEDGGNSFLQDITYAYNERGWLKDINSPLFHEQMRYNTQTQGATVNYNGNISEEETTTSSGNRSFKYAYDAVNRLTDGISSGNNLSETGIIYDKGGNMTKLYRNGAVLNNSYYSNSNQMYASSGLVNTLTIYGPMQYDGNGNLYFDYRNDRILYADFNIFGKPDDFSGSMDMFICYDGSGEKIEEEDNVSGIYRYYIKGMEYTENVNISIPLAIDFIQTEEGRAVPNGSGGFKYEYTLKDHLGNNRLNFDEDPSITTPTPRVIQETDYYPFGLSATISVFGNKNNYLYNGKELRDQFNEYDYGARYYDPVIARWTGIDPLVEDYEHLSPYNYAENNPINNIDIDGMWSRSTNADNDDGKPKPAPPAPKPLKEVIIKGKLPQSENAAAPAIPFLVGLAEKVPARLLLADVTLQEVPVVNLILDGITIYYLLKDVHFAAYTPAPKTLKGFPGAKRTGNKGSGRTRWKNNDGKLLEWDSQHGDVEVYNDRGNHLGSANPDTGEMTKDPVGGRKIEP